MAINDLYVLTGKYNQEPLLISNSKKSIAHISSKFDYSADNIVEVPYIEDNDDIEGGDFPLSLHDEIKLIVETCAALINNVTELTERIEALESQVQHD